MRLLHVGRLVRTKGARDVIRAMAELRDLPVVLDVVGDGNDRQACADLVRELGLADRVTVHGAVPRAEVDAFYERPTSSSSPSYREPGGAVVLEAMSHGLPLVVCDRGGPGANVTDACASGCPHESPDQLARDVAGRSAAWSPSRTCGCSMGEAAREHVAAEHLWERRVDQHGGALRTGRRGAAGSRGAGDRMSEDDRRVRMARMGTSSWRSPLRWAVGALVAAALTTVATAHRARPGRAGRLRRPGQSPASTDGRRRRPRAPRSGRPRP